MSECRSTDGARELRAYLNEKSMNVPDFCEKHGLDRIGVQRVLNGERWKRISVDFAFAVETATGGRVKMKSWLSRTSKPGKVARANREAA